MSASGLRLRATSGMRWTTLSAGVTAVAQLAQVTILARVLDPADFGVMGVVLVVVGFAQAYMDLGVGAAIIHRQGVGRAQLSTLYWLNVLAGVAVFLLVLALVPAIVALFGEPRLALLLRVTAVVFLITPLGRQFEILLQKELAFDLLARQEMAAAIIGFGAAVAAALAGLGVWALVLGTIASVVTRTVLAVLVGLRRFRPSWRFSREDLRGFVRFGAFQVGEQTASYLSGRLDQLLIGSLLGVQALGFYNFAFNLTAQPASRINPAVTRVAFPVFSLVQDETARLRGGFLRVVGVLGALNAPLLLGLAAVAPVVVPLVFGAKWTPSVTLVQLLALVALSRSLGNPVGSLQLAKGRADLGFKWNVLLLALSIPAVILGARIGGLVGVAVGMVVVQLVAQVLSYFALIKPLLGPCGREYAGVLLRPVGLASLMVLALLPLRGLTAEIAPAALAVLHVALGAVVYLVALRLFEARTWSEFKAFTLARG